MCDTVLSGGHYAKRHETTHVPETDRRSGSWHAGLASVHPLQRLGRAGVTPPSERITLASIGVGGMGTNNMRAFLAQPDVQVVAVCDVVEANNEYGHWYKKGWNGEWFGREPARKIVENEYAQKSPSGGYKGCKAYVDFREIIARRRHRRRLRDHAGPLARDPRHHGGRPPARTSTARSP